MKSLMKITFINSIKIELDLLKNLSKLDLITAD